MPEKGSGFSGRHADCAAIDRLWPSIVEFQRIASQHGIFDIFQDNGGKYLRIYSVLGIRSLPGREGNDAVDSNGNEYEVKTLNLFDTKGRRKSSPSFTTHHHLNSAILGKSRSVKWIFAVFSGIELDRVYIMGPEDLATHFEKWECQFPVKGSLNNPKIPLKFVEQNGERLI